MHLIGAACHGCLLIAETSCEQRNDWLDRALIVPTLAVTDAAFFVTASPIPTLRALPTRTLADLPQALRDGRLTEAATAFMVRYAVPFTAARFINGESISGNPLGVRIAAGNVPNLVDPMTGKWGAHNPCYSPYSVETWRSWEYWAIMAGCGRLLTRPNGAHTKALKG